jgi:hypothetical protein
MWNCFPFSNFFSHTTSTRMKCVDFRTSLAILNCELSTETWERIFFINWNVWNIERTFNSKQANKTLLEIARKELQRRLSFFVGESRQSRWCRKKLEIDYSYCYTSDRKTEVYGSSYMVADGNHHIYVSVQNKLSRDSQCAYHSIHLHSNEKWFCAFSDNPCSHFITCEVRAIQICMNLNVILLTRKFSHRIIVIYCIAPKQHRILNETSQRCHSTFQITLVDRHNHHSPHACHMIMLKTLNNSHNQIDLIFLRVNEEENFTTEMNN